jgi:DNA-binding transcriptional regulator YhcF (GntR family)
MAGEPSSLGIFSYRMALSKSQSIGPVARRKDDLIVPAIVLDHASPAPLYEQIRGQIAQLARRGGHVGARLPSTRLLARMLGVSRNTVVTAYEELAAEGVIEGRAGSRMVVAGQPRGPMSGFDPVRVLREAQYPQRTLTFEDPDGSAIYISY